MLRWGYIPVFCTPSVTGNNYFLFLPIDGATVTFPLQLDATLTAQPLCRWSKIYLRSFSTQNNDDSDSHSALEDLPSEPKDGDDCTTDAEPLLDIRRWRTGGGGLPVLLHLAISVSWIYFSMWSTLHIRLGSVGCNIFSVNLQKTCVNSMPHAQPCPVPAARQQPTANKESTQCNLTNLTKLT